MRRTKKIIYMIVSIIFCAGAISPTKALALEPAPVLNDTFSFQDPNKTLHFFGSYAVAFTGTTLLKEEGFSLPVSILISSAATFAAFTFKERYLDSRYSQGDEVGNVLGIATSAVMSVTIHF